MEVFVWKLLLVLTNFSLLAYLLVQMIRHYNSHYDTASWGFIFQMLSFCWLVMRGAFWLATMAPILRWTVLNFYFLYWMPVPFEFAAFMLLPLYFAQVLYPEEWKQHWHNVRPFYFSLIVGLLIFQALWAWLAATPTELRCAAAVDDYDEIKCFHTEYSSKAFRAVSGICFLFLAIVQCFFGLKILSLDAHRYARYFTTPQHVMAVVNTILVSSFMSRSLYQMLAMNNVYVLPDVPIDAEGDLPVSIFIIFEWWVYVPTVLTIATTAARSQVTSNASNNRFGAVLGYYALPTYGAIIATNDGEETSPSSTKGSTIPLSRQGSFKSKSSPVMPILYPAGMEPVHRNEMEYILSSGRSSNPSSLSNHRNLSWLSGADPPRYWKPHFAEQFQLQQQQQHEQQLSNSHEGMGLEKGASLTNYFRKQRLRSTSMNSDTSDGSANTTQQHQQAARPMTIHFSKDDNRSSNNVSYSHGSSGHHHHHSKRPVRYYNEPASSSSYQQQPRIHTNDNNFGMNSRSISGERPAAPFVPRLDSNFVAESSNHGSSAANSSLEAKQQLPPSPPEPEAEYEFQVEPASPAQFPSDIRLARSSSGAASITNSARTTPRVVVGYESTGGDHVHTMHDHEPVNNVAVAVAGATQRDRESSGEIVEDHMLTQFLHAALLESNNNNDEELNNVAHSWTSSHPQPIMHQHEDLPPYAAVMQQPMTVFPRPTRPNPQRMMIPIVAVIGTSSNHDTPEPLSSIMSRSISPITSTSRARSSLNSSATPDREEAAREALRVRQGLSGPMIGSMQNTGSNPNIYSPR